MQPARNTPSCPLWLRWIAMLSLLVAHAGAVAGPLLVRVKEAICFRDCDAVWVKVQ